MSGTFSRAAGASPPPPLAGAVLCGGESRRMGRDKALIRFEGRALVVRAVERLRPACDPVLIAAGELPIDLAGCVPVADAAPGAGPLGGVIGALRSSPHALLAIVAVDMPWIDPALLRLLAARIDDRDAAVAHTEHGPEPLHAVYARSALAACEAMLSGPDHSLRGLLAGLRVRRVTTREWRAAGIAPGFAGNVNTPADLRAITASRRPGREPR